MKLKDVPEPLLWAAVAGVGALVLYHVGRRGLAAVGAAVNPTSDKNLVYRGSGAVLHAAGVDESDTLGTALHRWLND